MSLEAITFTLAAVGGGGNVTSAAETPSRTPVSERWTELPHSSQCGRGAGSTADIQVHGCRGIYINII